MRGIQHLIHLLMLSSCSCYHVMILHNFGTKSHLYQIFPLVEELLERGNHVTAAYYGTAGLDHENYTEIIIPNLYDKILSEFTTMLVKDGLGATSPRLIWWGINIWYGINEELAEHTFGHPYIKKMIEEKPKVDAVITMLPFGALLAHAFDCPIIQFSPTGPFFSQLEFVGNILNPSVQPYLFTTFIEPMTFKERLINHFLYKISCLGVEWFSRVGARIMSEHYGEELPSAADVMRNRTALLLTCSHPVTHGAWPYTQAVVEIGGIHIKPGKALPDYLQEFLDNSTQGVVLVSFGSTLSPSAMPESKKQIFIETFRELNIPIIWKWDSEIENLPENVKIFNWLPQQDLLAHPNLKVFVTHGGLLSVMEALYHKTVIVGIPFVNDQKPNLRRAEKNGYAKMLEWNSLTKEDLSKAIKDAISDKKMETSLAEMHTLFVDQSQAPAHRAAWWVEHVCKHGGAPWLRSAGMDTPWYTFHHLDILLFLTTCIAVFIAITIICCKFCYKFSFQEHIKSD